jgi:hypothetical protein
VREFVDDLRDLNVTPHIAQNTSNRTSATLARRAIRVMRSASPGARRSRSAGPRPLVWSREAHAARGCTLEIQVYSDDGSL